MWNKFKKAMEDKIIFLFMAIPIGIFIVIYIRLFTHNNPTVMNILYGLISTLIGALVGGFCSLAASVYAGDQQVKITMKHDAQTKMRDTYYLPVYLELVKAENQLNQIYSAEWERIRCAAKVLEIPLQIESSLEAVRKEYLLFRNESENADQKEKYLYAVKKAKHELECMIRKINRME